LCLFAVLLWSAGTISGAELRVGAAATVINPPPGIPLAGYYSERGSQGVLDDIYSKAAVLDDGSTKVALIVCDLVSLPRNIVVEARKLIEQQTGISGAHIMISATHSHTGPVLTRASARDALDGGNSDLSRKYTAELPALIAQSAADANKGLTSARLLYARETESHLSFCRRYWMLDGTVGWNPGK